MSAYNRPTNQSEFQSNFSQIKPLMNPTMAFYESARCLFCYDAPCIKACPTDIDIPLFIRQINTGNLDGAAKTIYSQNYFGNTCGKVCPTEVLCEGACVYNEQDVKPIEIGRLQNFASQHAIENDLEIFGKNDSLDRKIAVIGAGPAGISCACELSALGYQVDVFESKSSSGGLALHGTAPYKILNQEVENEIQYLQSALDFKIHYNSPIRSIEAIHELEENYDAICLAIGLGETRRMRLAGEELMNCIGATEFIEALKSDPMNTYVGKQVVVIGGGNTAMDAASEAARMGAEKVTLIYRRAQSSMSAYEFELELAKSVGVYCIFEAQPFEIVGNNTVEAVNIRKTRNVSGALESIPGSERSIPCDMVIKATGQEKQTQIFDLLNVQYDSKGKVAIENGHYQTSKAKYFVAGDALNGGAEVVNACGEAKKAAQEIHAFIQK